MPWDGFNRRPRLILLLTAMLLAALTARCTLPIATTEPYVDAIQQLKERRADVDGYSRGCFTQGWGADPAYATMTRREAQARAEQLIAAHTARLAAWQTCQREIAPKLEAYRAAAEQAKARIPSAPHMSSEDADRIGQLLDESVQSTTALARDAFPMVVELERAYVEHFRQLQAGPPGGKKRLVFPDHIERRERQVIRTMHQQVASAAAYAEALHRLAPSPETRARMNTARIMAAIYRGLDAATADDLRTDAERFSDFRREVQAARSIVEGEINDSAYAQFRPTTVARYRTMLGELKQADATLGKLVTLAERGPNGNGKPARSGKVLARFKTQTGQLLTSVRGIVTRVERLAQTIDAEP